MWLAWVIWTSWPNDCWVLHEWRTASVAFMFCLGQAEHLQKPWLLLQSHVLFEQASQLRVGLWKHTWSPGSVSPVSNSCWRSILLLSGSSVKSSRLRLSPSCVTTSNSVSVQAKPHLYSPSLLPTHPSQFNTHWSLCYVSEIAGSSLTSVACITAQEFTHMFDRLCYFIQRVLDKHFIEKHHEGLASGAARVWYLITCISIHVLHKMFN